MIRYGVPGIRNPQKLLRATETEILKWTEDGRLTTQLHVSEIVQAWQEWADSNVFQETIDKLIENDGELINFIMSFYRKPSGKLVESKNSVGVHPKLKEILGARLNRGRLAKICSSDIINERHESERVILCGILESIPLA